MISEIFKTQTSEPVQPTTPTEGDVFLRQILAYERKNIELSNRNSELLTMNNQIEKEISDKQANADSQLNAVFTSIKKLESRGDSLETENILLESSISKNTEKLNVVLAELNESARIVEKNYKIVNDFNDYMTLERQNMAVREAELGDKVLYTSHKLNELNKREIDLDDREERLVKWEEKLNNREEYLESLSVSLNTKAEKLASDERNLGEVAKSLNLKAEKVATQEQNVRDREDELSRNETVIKQCRERLELNVSAITEAQEAEYAERMQNLTNDEESFAKREAELKSRELEFALSIADLTIRERKLKSREKLLVTEEKPPVVEVEQPYTEDYVNTTETPS